MISQLTENHQTTNLKKEFHIVAFLDILGFEGHINKYSDDNQDFLNELIQALEKAKNEAINYLDVVYKTELDDDIIIEYKQFSDSTYISIPYSENDSDFVLKFSANLKWIAYLIVIDP